MTFNKNCFNDLIKFIEDKLEFKVADTVISNGMEPKGVLIRDFIEANKDYPLHEIKYAFHTLKQLQLIDVDNNPIGDNVLINDFSPRGYDYLLNVIHKD